MEMQITIDVEVLYKFIKGKSEHFNSQFGNYLPADPHEVQDLDVVLTNNGKSICLVKYLSADDIEKIKKEIILREMEMRE